MNIVVKPYSSSCCYCRPDTTWERENKDYYVPECIDSLDWAPIVFVRISKAGKCIGSKFASRYYDSFNFGALVYCNRADETEIASTSCADHTSILPFPLYNTAVMETEGNIHEVRKDGERIFIYETAPTVLKEAIENAICKASETISLRIGDFVAVELMPKSALASREKSGLRLDATFCENGLYDFKIIF